MILWNEGMKRSLVLVIFFRKSFWGKVSIMWLLYLTKFSTWKRTLRLRKKSYVLEWSVPFTDLQSNIWHKCQPSLQSGVKAYFSIPRSSSVWLTKLFGLCNDWKRQFQRHWKGNLGTKFCWITWGGGGEQVLCQQQTAAYILLTGNTGRDNIDSKVNRESQR